MDFLIVYLVIGVFISMALSEVDKWEIDGLGDEIITNRDRIIFILVWPIVLFGFLKEKLANNK